MQSSPLARDQYQQMTLLLHQPPKEKSPPSDSALQQTQQRKHPVQQQESVNHGLCMNLQKVVTATSQTLVAYQKVTGEVAGEEEDAIDVVAVVVEALGELVESGHNLVIIQQQIIRVYCMHVVTCLIAHFYPRYLVVVIVGDVVMMVLQQFIMSFLNITVHVIL